MHKLEEEEMSLRISLSKVITHLATARFSSLHNDLTA